MQVFFLAANCKLDEPIQANCPKSTKHEMRGDCTWMVTGQLELIGKGSEVASWANARILLDSHPAN